MKITVLGAGAMGMLFGGYLSQHNDVWVLDVDQSRVDKINRDGARIREKDGDRCFYPKAVSRCEGLPVMDLVIVFIKAMYSMQALETNRPLIGPNTYVMTLQNGSGHEAKLLRVADRDHVIIGSTQHNSSVISNGYANHGGGGKSSIGLLNGHSEQIDFIAETFTHCGIECVTSNEVKKQIWTKLFLNTSASALTAVLQMPLGYIYDDPHAHTLMLRLVHEAVTVANAEGEAHFEEAEVVDGIETVLKNGRGGLTSIYADIKNGARTEVDTISGSVVETARRLGLSVPYHEMLVETIHAMEGRGAYSVE